MSISITDPLALVAIQAGQVGTPSTEAAAAGSSKLDSQQRSVEIGEPVPIVFGRRRSIGGITAGGVLISPGATECRFENDTSNNVTAYYHLVLSEGEIDSIPVKDVFQRSCRVGSHSQTYNRRAGTWTPANAIVQREGYDKPEATYYCGSKGAYPGMSTLSFNVTIPDGFDQWNRQVHCFIRGGMYVTRLYDDITGPSDNFADLVQWMLTNSGRVPTSLIDTTALDAAATFLEVNGFTCNCWITESVNYADLLTKWAPYFLLCESNASGKRGLRPVLPTTEAGAIDTGAITPVWTFTEDHITAGSLEIQYSNLAERRPFVAQVIWRQQLEDDFGILRTAEVRYSGTAETGPYESHDLSEFCTTENHAVKVGAYILSKRTRTSHTIRFSAKPQANNTTVTAGDIIRVRLARQATTAGTGYHDFLYQVERITKTLAGELSYECTHFPVDADGKSLIALDVAAAAGTGILLTSNKSGVGCDINSPSDNTIPAETWSAADDLGSNQTLIVGDYESAPDGDVNNSDDYLDFKPDFPGSISPPQETGIAADGSAFAEPANPCAGTSPDSTSWQVNGTPIVSAVKTKTGALVIDNTKYPAGSRYTYVAECPDGSQTVYFATSTAGNPYGTYYAHEYQALAPNGTWYSPVAKYSYNGGAVLRNLFWSPSYQAWYQDWRLRAADGSTNIAIIQDYYGSDVTVPIRVIRIWKGSSLSGCSWSIIGPGWSIAADFS